MNQPVDKVYRLSSEKMTVMVTVRGKAQVIITAAPVVRIFIGQRLDNLQRWMRRQGGFEQQELVTHD